MAEFRFREQIDIRQCTPQRVIDVLSGYQVHHQLHPLIVKVEALSQENPCGHYAITDRLVWGPFTFRIVYRVELLDVTADRIHTRAYQKPGVVLDNVTHVTERGDSVTVTEQVVLRAPRLLLWYASREARKAHRAFFARLKTFLETESQVK